MTAIANDTLREPVSALDTIPRIGDLMPPIRRRFVHHLIGELADDQTDERSALLILDLAGLAGDRDLIDDALTARQTRDGLRDGTLDPYQVDPDVQGPRDVAAEVLAAEADGVYQSAVERLATPRATYETTVAALRGQCTAAAGAVTGGAR